MTFPAKCNCGLYHYTFQHWSQTHGKSKPFIDPYIQKPFVEGELWNEKDYDHTEPYPTITWKWVCQFCGISNNNHTAECDFYLEHIKKWEDIKGGVYSTTYTHTSTSTGTTPPKKEPKPDETETKKTLKGWYDIGQVSKLQYLQLVKIVVKNAQYTLTNLLSHLPKTKPPTPQPSPKPDPTETKDTFLEALTAAENELTALFYSHVVLAPYFNPADEVDEMGKTDWEGKSWKEFLSTADDDIDVDFNKNNILNFFGQVMIIHCLEDKDIKRIDDFKKKHPTITDYTKFEAQIKKLREEKDQPDLLDYLNQVEKDNKEFVEKGTITPDLDTYWYRVDEQLIKLAEWDDKPTLIKTGLENLFTKISPFFSSFSDKGKRHKQVGERIKIITDKLFTKVKEKFVKELQHKGELTHISFEWEREIKKITGENDNLRDSKYIKNATEKDWEKVKENCLIAIARLPNVQYNTFNYGGLYYWKWADNLDEYLKIATSPVEKNILENDPVKSLIKEVRDNPPFPREVPDVYKKIKTWEQFVKVHYPKPGDKEKEPHIWFNQYQPKYFNFFRSRPNKQEEDLLTVDGNVLDLSAFPNLKGFFDNKFIKFAEINVSNNPLLEKLILDNHRELKKVVLGNKPKLFELKLQYTEITELNLSDTNFIEADYNKGYPYNERDGIKYELKTTIPKDKIIFAGQTKGSWDDVLDKIYNKFNGSDKPKNLNQVKEFVEKELKTLPKSGIEGDIWKLEAKKEDLLKLTKGSANTQLASAKGEFEEYKTWTALDSDRDGNCFLNSFSLLMKGDQTLSTELRVRMCIFLMNNPNLIGAFDEKDQLALLIDKLTKNEHDGKKQPLAQKKEWLFTDDIKFISDILQRPVRVIYRPQQSQFKDYEAILNFSKITGGWGKLEYYEPEQKNYKTQDWWTICHVSGNHFEPLISPNEDKAELPTEINLIFQKLNNGVDSVIRGEVDRSEYLMSKDFENALSLLDGEEYGKEIYHRIKNIITKKIGLKLPTNESIFNKLPYFVQVMTTKLKEVCQMYKKYNGNGDTPENQVDIYFEASDAYVGGNLMISVKPRPDEKDHIIGDAWKNSEGMINVYVEKDDPNPGKYKDKELRKVFLAIEDNTKTQKIFDDIKNRSYNSVICHVKGEVSYDPSIKSLNFKKGTQIELEILLPL